MALCDPIAREVERMARAGSAAAIMVVPQRRRNRGSMERSGDTEAAHGAGRAPAAARKAGD